MGERESESWKQQRQKLVPIFVTEFITALILTVGWFYGGYYYCDFIPVPESMSVRDIWIYYVRCCAVPCALLLCFSIFAVISKRVQTPAANPLGGNESIIQVEKNILANTVEQILLFLLTSAILATYLNQSEMKILPLFGSFWAIGRILFNIGYRIGFQYRSLGILCNMFSSVFFLSLSCYFIYFRGMWFNLATTYTGTRQDIGNIKPEL